MQKRAMSEQMLCCKRVVVVVAMNEWLFLNLELELGPPSRPRLDALADNSLLRDAKAVDSPKQSLHFTSLLTANNITDGHVHFFSWIPLHHSIARVHIHLSDYFPHPATLGHIAKDGENGNERTHAACRA